MARVGVCCVASIWLLTSAAAAQLPDCADLEQSERYSRGMMLQVPGEEMQHEIRLELAGALGTMLTPGGFSQTVGSLTEVARTRMAAEPQPPPTDELDAKILEFQNTWRAKYHRDFDAAEQKENVFAYSFKRAPDQRQVTVLIPAAHGLLQTRLRLYKEGVSPLDWRFDVPRDLSEAELLQRLTAQLTLLEGMKDRWPAWETEAKRFVAHYLFTVVAASRVD